MRMQLNKNQETQIKYIDAHAHPHFSAFDQDRVEMFQRMQQASVASIAVGTDYKTSREAVEFAQKYDLVLAATIGIHPTDNEEFNFDKYQGLLNENVCAIGECGLDYYRMDGSGASERKRQKDLFELQIQFAIENRLPLMLHIRSSQGSSDAHNDAFDILHHYKRQAPDLHLHMHFFTADKEVAKKFLELDASFGIPGVVTFAKSLEEVVEYIPENKILIESDAPYAAPVPYRGKRNESAYIIHTIEKIAQIKMLDTDLFAEIALSNTLRVFNLKV